MRIHRISVAHIVTALLLPAAIHGQQQTESAVDDVGLRRVVASLHGDIVDAATREPVANATVRLRESGRTELSHSDGSFHFDNIRAGLHTITIERIGYLPAERAIDVVEGEPTRISIAITPSALHLAAVIVTGAGSERAATSSYRSMAVLSDAELRRRLGGSVAATLAGQPGLAQRYNGPVAAQPVVRGLSGDRVLMLEDGQRTGDIAATSPDHAITIEPLTAERIEVVRGPAGVLYGSNSLGGVINVIREDVPRSVPEHITGMITTQYESVNSGFTGGGAVRATAGPFAVRAELSGRTAGDSHTPEGVLPGSDLDGYNTGFGISHVGQRGHAGASVRDYSMAYGVPGTFDGEVIPGAHEEGVHIDLRRTVARVEGRLLGSGGSLRSVEADANFVRFDQKELEHHDDGDESVGTHFRQYSASGSIRAHHRHDDSSIRHEGAFGASAGYRDLDVTGSETGSRPARHYTLALFAFEEFDLDPFNIEVGARYDWTRVDPLDTSPGLLGDVRRRDFQSVSGSIAALYRPAEEWATGISVSRSFRTPSMEDLFSNGPHLANYSFDIGNPDLDPEYGLGLDVFVRATLPSFHAEVGVFRNAISDYIYQAPTGELDPELGLYPVYQAEQGDVVLTGIDGSIQWELIEHWVVDANASYVRGRRGDVDLPAMPPAHGAVNVRRDGERFFAGLGFEGAAAQDHVGEFEVPTAAYALINATAGVRWTAFDRLNTITIQARNILDTAWRDHLSRIRSVAPQPGRNVQVLYKLDL